MDIYNDPMLNVADTATYLAMPSKTLGEWSRSSVIHSRVPLKRGWPSLPFVAVVEAYVLRELRKAGFTRAKIQEAADGIRRAFGDEYGLARPGIGHDQGAEIFFEVGGDLFRAKDSQQALRETVEGFQHSIQWNGQDPQRLRLQYIGDVYLDPRFGWGQPTVGESRVSMNAVYGLWQGGASLTTISEEYDIPEDEVDSLVRSWSRLYDRQRAA